MISRGKFLGATKLLVIIIAVFGMIIPLGAGATHDDVSRLEEKLAELKRQEELNKQALERTKRESNNLTDAISNLNGDIAYTTNRISNTQAQIDTTNEVIESLNKDIASSQNELELLNNKLNNAYISLYEMSQVSTLEIVLQSDTLEDIVSQTQYVQSIQTSLQDGIEKQNQIKSNLESKKADADKHKAGLESLRTQLSQSRTGLSSQRNQKDYLLEQTLGEQSRYEKLLAQLRSEVTKISSEIYQARLAAGGFINNGGTGGYPWAGKCDNVDSWLYYTCQCTSYAAWKFLSIHGVPFMNTRPGSGSAYNWPNLARDQGYTVSSTPKVGDAVSWDRPLFSGDLWGHVAIVETVYASNDIVVSEYNWSPAKKYSVRRINPNNYGAPRYLRP